MSIVNTVGRGVAWNTAATVVGKLFIFFNIFLILRTLTVYDYGLSQLVLSVIPTLGIFLLPGLTSVITADLAAERGRNDFARMKAIFLQFAALTMLLAILAWALLFFGASLAAHLSGNDAIGNLIRIASFTLLVSPLRTISQLLATVELRFFDQSFYGVFEEIAKGILLVFFFFVFHLGLVGFFYATVLCQFVTVLAYLPRSFSAYRVFSGAEAKNVHAFWEMLRMHRKWSIATSYVGTLGSTLQIWIIRFMLGTEAVGLFSFADGIYGQVTALAPLSTVLAPILPRYVDQPLDFARYLKSSIKAQTYFSIVLIGMTFFGLPILVRVFPKYEPALPIIMVMIFSVIPSTIVGLYTPAFAALKQQYAYFWSFTWKVVFIATFTYFSIAVWGTIGIGISTLLFTFASMIERTWRLQKVLPEFIWKFNEFFTFDAYERMLLQHFWKRWSSFRVTLPF